MCKCECELPTDQANRWSLLLSVSETDAAVKLCNIQSNLCRFDFSAHRSIKTTDTTPKSNTNDLSSGFVKYASY